MKAKTTMSFFKKPNDVDGLRDQKRQCRFWMYASDVANDPEIGGLDVPASRKWFLETISRGVEPTRAAAALGIDVRTVQRYAQAHAHFLAIYKDVKREGRQARRLAEGEVPLMLDAPDAPAPRPPRPRKRRDPAPTGDGYLEQYEKAEPGGLVLNAHLPPLSVETFLAQCQSLLYDKDAPPQLRVAAMKQIGAYTLLPILCPPPPPPPRSETGTDAHPPARAAIPGGVRVQVVTMEAPDNGLYAPGRAPGQAQVVDEAEADEAEVVEARSS